MLFRDSAKAMLVIGLLLTGYAAQASEQDHHNAVTNPYLDELLSVLSNASAHELVYFSELDTVAARYSFSLPEYTHACLESYNGLKISPANKVKTSSGLVDAQIEYLMKWLDTFGYAFHYREKRNKAKMDVIQAAIIQLHSSFTTFADVVGFDIDAVLEGNYYLSKMPLHQARKILSFIAYEVNIPVREYVDVCAEAMAEMRITSDEMEEMHTLAQFFGREWGKNNYNSTDELIEKLINDDSPFIPFVSKRRDFVMSRSNKLLNVTQLFLKKMDADLHDFLLKMNNRAASGASSSDYTINLFSESTWSQYFAQKRALGRDLERVYCSDLFFQTIFESSHGLDGIFRLRF